MATNEEFSNKKGQLQQVPLDRSSLISMHIINGPRIRKFDNKTTLINFNL